MLYYKAFFINQDPFFSHSIKPVYLVLIKIYHKNTYHRNNNIQNNNTFFFNNFVEYSHSEYYTGS